MEEQEGTNLTVAGKYLFIPLSNFSDAFTGEININSINHAGDTSGAREAGMLADLRGSSVDINQCLNSSRHVI